MSYSQYDEERFIVEAVGGMSGSFLDLGAYHPTEKSNTRALFEGGWGGVMVEPSPGPMRALLVEYGKEDRIKLIQAAVALTPGLVDLWVSDDAVSTSDQSSYATWKEAGGFFGQMRVPAITLNEIANQFGGFDFVNIDIEGLSVDLFTQALYLGWEPKCWCVEHNDRLGELLTEATGKGYVATMTNSCNVVLVKK